MPEDRITLRLPQNFRRAAKVKAAKEDKSLNTWIVEAVQEKLEKENIMILIDHNGREGIVVEQRERGVFARPIDAPAYVESGPLVGVEGKAMTQTFWSYQEDGSLKGLWYDSPINEFVIAQITST